jgi:hypothetical protein
MSKTFRILLELEDNWFVAKCLENGVTFAGTISEASYRHRNIVCIIGWPKRMTQTFTRMMACN